MNALTHHGGRIDRAALTYPDAPTPWLDLSTGINPVAWAPPAGLALDWARLPSPAALAGLEASAASYFGADAASVVAVPGTEIALRMLARLDLPTPHRHVVPGYRTHGVALPASSAIPIAAAGDAGGSLLLANPGNPEGGVLAPAVLAGLAEDRWLIVDEAFADIDAAISIVPSLPARTIVLRSFGKFFGLAGVRLGFVVGPSTVVTAFRAMLGDWPVSAAAIAFGTAAYRDADWIAATRARLVEDAAALDRVLAAHRLEAGGACPLFRLIRAAPGLFERLARAGILTRPFDDAPDRVRLGLPRDAAGLDRLAQALGGAPASG